ncbi:hypothetical protein [Actinoplanes sp. M2I2]|uniref:hypothetical protein n=1 Tax=Actinoplanes sp. M2I2 TaxID=1734444 RepID=UPI00201FDE26|nr:hypothetical protein [Actinoplanes sp. M2I2]
MATREFIPVDLDRISDITYTCSVFRARKRGYFGGVISFSGDYRPGSSGSGDAAFIKWKINEFLDIDDPGTVYGLVVDLRGLRYEWGEDLGVAASRLRRGRLPLLTVVDPHARAALAHCIADDEMRADFDAAVDEVAEALARLT